MARRRLEDLTPEEIDALGVAIARRHIGDSDVRKRFEAYRARWIAILRPAIDRIRESQRLTAEDLSIIVY
jgi:hypothetical protein